MDTFKPVDADFIERALNGQLEQPAVQNLIENLQARLDDLLPTANRVFANVVTEAFDMTQGSKSMGLAEALSNISALQAELDAILYPSDDLMLQAISGDLLPSPEMLFSDPDHVPRFVDWATRDQSAAHHEIPLHVSLHNGISSNGSLNPLDPNGDRFDA